MIYILTVITAIVLWKAVKINLFLACAISIVGWTIIGALLTGKKAGNMDFNSN